MPREARDTLNTKQRLVYDAILGHYRATNQGQNPAPLRIQVDGGGGTGKSYMIKVISSRLQAKAASRGQPSPIIRAAPTGVASNQIGGQTLHSLFRLPIDGNYRPLSETPTVLSSLQRRFNSIHYLIIDEKSMLGLKPLAWVDQRLREIFPNRRDQYFGGLSVILIGDFFQLPPVLNKPLYSTADGLRDMEIVGRNAYLSFDKSVFLTTVQRQQGEDQALFRQALEELRRAKVSVSSWELLTSRCAIKLPPAKVEAFDNALRIFPIKAQVDEYNHRHLLGLRKAVVQVNTKHEGAGAERVESSNAGNLIKRLPLCVGCRVMLTRNLWANVGLVNGAQGTVYDISWAEGANVLEDPPQVIMVTFDNYTGPPFLLPGGEELRDGAKLVVPILRVRQEFVLGAGTGYREQFPLLVCYAITVHKSQGVTLDKVVYDVSAPEFASGLSYVAVSRVKTLDGLMFESPFDRSRIYREAPVQSMQLKIADYEARRLQLLDPPEEEVDSSDISGYITDSSIIEA
jgi:ATP-dependent DNA helicase PIF1